MRCQEKPGVMVVDADQQRCQEVCARLRELQYQATPLYSLAELERQLPHQPSPVVLLDLDSVPADNYFFRGLKKKNLGVVILGMSNRPYHPGLEEAMGSHIYACLGKPLDLEELRYWLMSIAENLSEVPESSVVRKYEKNSEKF